MLATDHRDVDAEPFAEGITIRWLIGRAERAPNFAMRLIEFSPGEAIGPHEHPYEHEIFVLDGEGLAEGPDGIVDLQAGVALYIPPGEPHGYRNTGEGDLRLLCMIPHEPTPLE
jgi:quercetin dioxygenase-like cupin family protein